MYVDSAFPAFCGDRLLQGAPCELRGRPPQEAGHTLWGNPDPPAPQPKGSNYCRVFSQEHWLQLIQVFPQAHLAAR